MNRTAVIVLTVAAAITAAPALAGATDRAGDRSIAEDSLLTAQEVPAGFEVIPSTSDSEAPSGAECRGIRRGRTALNAAPSEEIDFIETPADGSGSARINNRISVFAETRAAKAAYSGYAGPDSEACFESTYEDLFVEQLDDPDATADVTASRYGPDTGDQSVGYALEIAISARGDSETLYMDIEVTRVGRAVSGFAVLDTGEPFSSDDIVAMTDAVAERLETALEA